MVPYARLGSDEDALDLLAARGFDAFALSPAARTRLTDLRPRARTALLLGAEGHGLPQDVLSRAQGLSIPMAGEFDSLNVAVTSGIALHHLRAASPPDIQNGAISEPPR